MTLNRFQPEMIESLCIFAYFKIVNLKRWRWYWNHRLRPWLCKSCRGLKVAPWNPIGVGGQVMCENEDMIGRENVFFCFTHWCPIFPISFCLSTVAFHYDQKYWENHGAPRFVIFCWIWNKQIIDRNLYLPYLPLKDFGKDSNLEKLQVTTTSGDEGK